LYESRAIGKYIATKYASSGIPLVPDVNDIKASAILEQAISVEYSDFEPSASGLAKEKLFKKWVSFSQLPPSVSR
jgi:glutathione S-transferase